MATTLDINDLSDEVISRILFAHSTIYDWNCRSRVCKRWNGLFIAHVGKMGQLRYSGTDNLVNDDIDVINTFCEFNNGMVRLMIMCTVKSYEQKTNCSIVFCAPIDDFRGLFQDNEIFSEAVSTSEIEPNCLISFIGMEIFRITSVITCLEVSFKIDGSDYTVKYEGGLIRGFSVNNLPCVSLILTGLCCEYVRATIFPAIINTFGNIFPQQKNLVSGHKHLCEIRGALGKMYENSYYPC